MGGGSSEGLPEPIRGKLDELQGRLEAAAGKNLAGLVLYGGLARGRYREGQSDVNLMVLLHDTGERSLAAIAPVLRAAWQEFRLEPMVLRPADVIPTAQAFPLKFLDIQANHRVLAGADVLLGLAVPQERIRLRAAQELRNLALHLRRRYLLSYDSAGGLTRVVSKSVVPLSIHMQALLRSDGKPAPLGESLDQLYARAAEAYGLDAKVLARIAAAREEAPKNAAGLYQAVLDTVDRLTAVAEVGRWT